MTNLLDLPNELLILVVSQFDNYMLKNELKSLCLTSKLLCSIAQPVLYTQFVREVQCQCCHARGPPPGRIVPLVLFIRTLITRPDLASRVRSARIDAAEDEYDDEDIRTADFDADTLQALAVGFQQLPGDDKARWFKEAVSMMSNPYLLLLASLVPNLEHLYLGIEEEGLNELEPLFTVWSFSSIKQPYLKNLKCLSIQDLSYSESDSLTCLSLAMTLPRLEDFTLVGINGDAEGCPYFDFAPGSLNISNLCLAKASLDATSLESIVKGCKCLKYFTYSGSNFYDQTVEESCQFDPSELVCILSSQKRNIRTIRCNLDWEGIFPTQWKKCSKYGSFAPFENICHLEVDQYPWSKRSQELPTSLHCLTIRNISFSIFDAVSSLSARASQNPRRDNDIRGDLPNLRRLALEPRDNNPNGMLEVRKSFNHFDVDESSATAAKFELACEVLLEIIEGCDFHVEVEHEVWEWYLEH